MKRTIILAMLLAAAGGLAWVLPGPEEALAAKTRIRVPQDQPTLQAAVDAAGPGFTISLTRGNYSENVLISGKTDLRIDGRGSTLNGGGAGSALDILDSTMVELRGLVFREGNPYGLVVRGVSADIEVSKCEFRGGEEAACLVGSAVARVSVEKCLFSGTPSHALRALSGATGVRVVGNEFEGVGGNGIALAFEGGGIGVPEAVVEKNRLSGVGRYGIVFGGDGTVVARNRVEGAASGWGIAVDDSTTTTGAVIEGNRVEQAAWGGIRCLGTGGIVSKNRVERTEGAGILAVGEGHLVTGNRVSSTRTAGVALNGTGITAAGNKLRQGFDDGLRVQGSLNVVEGNQSRGNNKYGYVVDGIGNTLSRNTASGNGDFDLLELLGPNTYVRNRFPKERYGAP